MNHQDENTNVNVFEQINQICRKFRKQISKSNSPRIENFLTLIPEDGRATLFSNLLEIEINYRRSQNESIASDEYLQRFPLFKEQVRHAFFEPTMGSVDSSGSIDGDDQTESLRGPDQASDALAPTHELPNSNRLGEYELIRQLGRGGFGVVYEARHRTRQNIVALKTLPAASDGQEINADRLHKFRKEFRSLSEYNHPNLVGMQSLEVDDGNWFFTMDLIDGTDLLSWVRPNNEPNETRLRQSIAQLAIGIIALHEQKIVHRDLKPSNVMVETDGTVKILDFGLVAELQTATDQTASLRSAQFAGTPRYAAPEQLFGERTEATDWYAFGVMLYEGLTGEPPFSGNQMELFRQKQNDDPPLLFGRDDVPEDLAQLADSLVKREPQDRIGAAEVIALLQIDLETRTFGSKTSLGSAGSQGSQGSTGSIDEAENVGLNWEEDKIELIGREEQLAQLESAKQELLDKRKPVVIFIKGLSGEGKSSLAEKFLRPLRRGEEMLVLSGRCYDRESVPFKVIDSIIEPLVRFLRSQSKADLEKILPPDVAALARLFPLLKRVSAISEQDTRQLTALEDKQIHKLAFVAFKELLVNIGQQFPIVIFVDDLQWGDADSAEVIFNLLASADSPAVLLLGSCRRDEVDESPFLTVWDQAKDGQPERIIDRMVEVHPLTPEQAVSLISRRVGILPELIEKQAGELIADTQGNPYFLEQLIEGFDAATSSFRAVPLNEIIATKLERLPPDAKPLIDAIAVAGRSVSLLEASQVCGFEQPAYGIVSHMRSERLVRLVGSGEQQSVDTYHDKIRETLLLVLDDQKKKDLHLAFGEWIERQFAPAVDSTSSDDEGTESSDKTANVHPRAADLAFHFAHADLADKAFQYSLDAGRQAMAAFAFSDAVGFLEQAHSLEPEDVADSERSELRFLTGKALSGVGRLDECIEHLKMATLLAPTPSDRAAAFFTLAETRFRKSDYVTAVAEYHRAFAELGERLPTSTIGKLFRTLCSVASILLIPSRLLRLFSRRSVKYMIQITRMYPSFSQIVTQLDMFGFLDSSSRTCAVAKTHNDPSAKCIADGFFAITLAISGVPALSGHMMNVSRRRARTVTSIPLLGAMHYQDGSFRYIRGQLVQAETELLQAENLFGKVDDLQLFFSVHFLRHLWSVRGNASKIEEYARKELEIAERSDDEITMAYGKYGLADAWSRQGKYDRSITIAQEAVDVLEKWDTTFKCIAYQELGRAQLQASDYIAARKSLAHAVHLVIRLRFFEISVPSFSLLAEAILGSDWIQNPNSLSRKDRRSAGRNASAARWSGWIFPNNRPHAYRVSGRLAVAKGKKRKATKYFDKAIAAAQKIGADYEYARALIDKSMLDHLGAASDRERGIALLESLGCVLPDAEVEYLGIDREAHHARAAAARETDSLGKETHRFVATTEARE